MPRYFFSVQDGQFLLDREGTLHANPEAARIAAVFASGEMLREHSEKFWKHPAWGMEVTNEQGETVCQLHFSGMAGLGL